MKLKTCSKCSEEQPLSAFYRDSRKADGHRYQCKRCVGRYERSPERREAMRTLAATPEHKAYRKAYNATPEQKARVKRCGASPEGKARRRKYDLNRDPVKTRARQALAYAVRVGNITRPNDCSVCGDICEPQGHHEDYSKPLTVDWLCRLCHTAVHIYAKNNRGNNND